MHTVESLKVPRKYLATFLACVGDGANTSLGLCRWLARINKVEATVESYEVILRFLEDAMRKELVVGRAGVAKGKVRVYIDLALTERGKAFLEGSKHRSRPLSPIKRLKNLWQ